MEFFKKYYNVLNILLINLALTFTTLIILHLFELFDINSIIRFRYIVLIVISLFSFSFFLFFKKEKKKVQIFEKYFKIFFLIGLLLLVLGNLNLEFFNLLIQRYILVFTLISAFFMLYFNKEKIKSEQEKELKIDKGGNWKYISILILILIIFTVVKAPYFETSFTGEHAMKYNSYVEPAKYMYEKGDPFWLQRKYEADPIQNPQGIRDVFGTPPFHEWGLLAFFNLFPSNSLELNTRLYTHALGLLILILSYVFLTKWFTRGLSLIVVFLLAINPIINFLSFITVEDSLLMIFTFLSLISLTKHIRENQSRSLFWSGLFLGLGNISKVSIFLWLFPIIFILLAFNVKKLHVFIEKITVISILSFLPMIAYRTSLRYLPTEVFPSLIKFLLWIIVFVLIFYLLKRYQKSIDSFFQTIFKKKILLIPLTILGVFFVKQFLVFSGFYYYLGEHFTDAQLILNWDMYKFMINDQLKHYMTHNIFYLGLLGILFGTLFSSKKHKTILFAFFIGSFFYWIIASKVIFFHSYYTGIIMVAFSLTTGIAIYFVTNIFQSGIQKLVIILLFVLLLFPNAYNSNIARLARERENKPLEKVAEFLKENTKENQIFIDDSYLLTLIFMTNRARITEAELLQEDIIESIQEIGFAKALEKYNIAYLVTSNETPKYDRYADLFTEEELEAPGYATRRDIILSRLNSNTHQLPDTDIRMKIVKEKKIEDKFLLLEDIEGYKIYGFRD